MNETKHEKEKARRKWWDSLSGTEAANLAQETIDRNGTGQATLDEIYDAWLKCEIGFMTGIKPNP